ncbi:NAD-P-binding protein [Phellopilus nigrolimitatus]|nr:NAD-P-binding protein [Phellopilus nigrolimitatus]
MAPVTNSRVLFNDYPEGKRFPEPEKTVVFDKSQIIDPDTIALNGGVLVKVLVLSVDPYLRNKMRKTEESAYTDNYTIGEPIYAFGIGKVVRSDDAGISAGDHLYGHFPFIELAVLSNVEEHTKIERVSDLPWSVYLGVCGMPGQTAYHGWTAYVHPHVKKGETLFVTTGSGPVGSLVIQLAKLDGLKIIASAGSEEKVKFMLDCGADVAFNYKTTSTKDILDKHGPINIYWDHVGGEILDLALSAADKFARFIECGMISGYNHGFAPVKNIAHVLFKNITMQGFIVGNLEAQFGHEFYRVIPSKVASGEIKYFEYAKRGLENTGQMFLDVQTGKNTGKALIIVADD